MQGSLVVGDQEKVKAGDIPKRLFGKTGEMLTVIGPGGARFRMVSWEEATAIVRRCYDLGINYYDNSHNYWGGRSEEVYGAVLPPFRKEVFITTKCDARTREGAERELDAGLKSMKTDYVDLWQLHKVGNAEDDLEAIFAPGGAMEALVAAKKAGKCRFIGFTVHGDPNTVVELLQASNDWDATLIPLNPADPAYLSFEQIALPAVVERGMGIQVMKSLGNGKLLKWMTARDCINYALSLPTHCIALGFTSLDQVEGDVRIARQHEPLAAGEMEQLRVRAAEAAGPDLEDWKKPLAILGATRETPVHDDV
ncbi:MAG: aldo/keto reductase [Candidatus Latescibacteria bacterium]|nr:aldo/keto reductase [Candidatus Latescibacterota bacterium]